MRPTALLPFVAAIGGLTLERAPDPAIAIFSQSVPLEEPQNITGITPRDSSGLPGWLTDAFYKVERRATCVNGRVACSGGTYCEFCGTCCSGYCASNSGNCCTDRKAACDLGYSCCPVNGCCAIGLAFCCRAEPGGCCVNGQTCTSTGCVGTG
jgi:hypothetical protein